MRSPLQRAALLVLGLGLTVLASCGSDDDSGGATTTVPATAAATTEPASSEPSSGSTTPDVVTTDHAHDVPTVTIGLRDYAFDDVPATVPVGTPLAITNSSTTEVHELVAVQLSANEQRSAAELIALPPDQLGALIGTEPAHVLIAPPGAAGVAVVGDGVLDEPGRYLLLCSIPIGADPQEYLAAAQAGNGPPQVAGGPPHFTAGMFAELVVEPGA